MLQLVGFGVLVIMAAAVCWLSRRPAVPVVFAVLFAIDGAYERMAPQFGGTASLAASAAIAFCVLALAMDKLSPER